MREVDLKNIGKSPSLYIFMYDIYLLAKYLLRPCSIKWKN